MANKLAVWVGRTFSYYLGRALLLIVGMVTLGFAFAQLRGGDPLSLSALGCGTAMVLAACLLPWIAHLRAGGRAGVDVGFRSASEVASLTTSVAMGSRADRSLQAKSDNVDNARTLLAQITLETLFRENDLLTNCRFHLYTLDDDGLLAPVLPLADEQEYDIESWAPGHGVVGSAWSGGGFLRAVGAACHDDTYGLSRRQQERYQAIQVVAAIPVRNGRGDLIGVVSSASEDESSPLMDDNGYIELVLVSELVARVLIDVLKWFDD